MVYECGCDEQDPQGTEGFLQQGKTQSWTARIQGNTLLEYSIDDGKETVKQPSSKINSDQTMVSNGQNLTQTVGFFIYQITGFKDQSVFKISCRSILET